MYFLLYHIYYFRNTLLRVIDQRQEASMTYDLMKRLNFGTILSILLFLFKKCGVGTLQYMYDEEINQIRPEKREIYF